jgi:hypothetical protein
VSDDIVARLRKQYVGNYNALLWDQAADEIERLRAERDEARREVCEMLERDAGFTATRQAENRGWDCFKEDGK